MIGTLLDHYEITAFVGAGGMGQVYEARDTKLGRRVAVKILPFELFDQAASRRRFEQEARSASMLNHPNIVTVHDVGQSNEIPYIIMELVQGDSLRELMDAGLPIARVLDLGAQIADGLSRAHTAGIVHRDLKPRNVMVTDEGLVKILDFGLAKLNLPGSLSNTEITDQVTEPGTIMGTVQYMSPEQASGRAADFRSDQFSLGLILYEMIAGGNPFSRPTVVETMAALISDAPEALRARHPETPPDVDDVVARCLAKKPEDRFASTDELREALKVARDRLSVSAVGPVGWNRFPAVWSARLALVALVLAGLGTVATVVYRGLRAPASSVASLRDLQLDADDWILIASFDNQTGDPLFDGSLDTAFRIGIDQSRFVRALPTSRIRGALKRMRYDANAPLEETTALEVAEREGASLVVLPSITGVGGNYLLTATLQDPASGAAVHAEMVHANEQSKILDALDELSRKTRQAVGETVSAIERDSTPLARATTSSLEALKEHSRGTEVYRRWLLKDAKAHYENALRIDPNFTAAKAQLGVLLVEQFGPDEQARGRVLIEQAIEELDGITELERLGILAFHAAAVDKDMDKAIEYARVRATSFPNDVASQHTLGYYYYQDGRLRESAAALERAIEVDPYFMMSANLLGFIYLYDWGDLASARALALDQIAHDDANAQAYDNLGWASVGYDDLNAAEENFAKAVELHPEFSNYRFRLAHIYRITGRYREALEHLDYIRQHPMPMFAGGEEETAADAVYDSGVVSRLIGDEQSAMDRFAAYREYVERLLRSDESAENYIKLGIVERRLGNTDEAERAEHRARQLDDDRHFDFARLSAVQGHMDEALARLERACASDEFSNYVWMKLQTDLAEREAHPGVSALFERHVKK